MIGIGEKFPAFELDGVNKDNELIVQSQWKLQDWGVVYFYPKDWTFICPTEISQMDILLQETEEVFGISGDNEYSKLNWKLSDDVVGGIEHTLLADRGLMLAKELGIVDDEHGVCYRATYILDPEGYIAHVSVNRDDTGRNAKEILRTLQALKAGGLTGCAWEPGEDFIA
jgi:peroxiredoxin (alkyl hydroperoxide reductase subunit C)|tara:strand:+ start:2502 stop:3011 length:510 start_codon:yes stop_codon:yes gene_type:complete